MPRLLSASSDHELSGKSSTSATRARDVLVVLPELAQRAEMEEPRLGQPRGLLEVGRQRVACLGVALQIEIRLGDPEIGKLPIVAAHVRTDRGKGGLRLGIAAGAEEHLRASEIRLVPAARDAVAERLELSLRGGAGRRQRVFVVEAHDRFGRLLLTVHGRGGPDQP